MQLIRGCLQLLLLATLREASGRQLPAAIASAAADCPNLVINTEWDVGIDCTLQFVVDHEAHGWEITLTFDSVLTSLDCWQVGQGHQCAQGYCFLNQTQ